MDGLALVVERVLHRTSGRSDPSPAAHQPDLAEQGLFDRQRIKPLHIPARVMAFDVKLIPLRDHAEQNRVNRFAGPMIALNHRTRIDSFQ